MMAVGCDGENGDSTKKNAKNETGDLFFHSQMFNTINRVEFRPNDLLARVYSST